MVAMGPILYFDLHCFVYIVPHATMLQTRKLPELIREHYSILRSSVN